MSQVKQSMALGIIFALITAVLWGAVPIAMKQVLPVMTPYTLVWYRFIISAIGLGIVLAVQGKLPRLRLFRRPRWFVILMIAALGLAANFIFFSSALQYLSPTASQVIGQLSPVGMLFASVIILKETMRITQIIGGILLILGLALFFNTNLVEIFTRLTDYTLGVLLGVLASLVWICYGVAQKVLQRRLSASQILFLLYVLSTLFVSPMAVPREVFNLNAWQLACLIFCGLNTLVAYGALGEAMARWQVAQVSALITLTPLFTLLFSDLLALIWPDYFSMTMLNILGYSGAFIVVIGAMISAAGHRLFSHRIKKTPVLPLK
ncbi:MAG: DMT family transporter [Enterobacteriaceae bacterium]|nr:DMT family transporter [Enterobacteriaceae bacterium]